MNHTTVHVTKIVNIEIKRVNGEVSVVKSVDIIIRKKIRKSAQERIQTV